MSDMSDGSLECFASKQWLRDILLLLCYSFAILQLFLGKHWWTFFTFCGILYISPQENPSLLSHCISQKSKPLTPVQGGKHNLQAQPEVRDVWGSMVWSQPRRDIEFFVGHYFSSTFWEFYSTFGHLLLFMRNVWAAYCSFVDNLVFLTGTI